MAADGVFLLILFYSLVFGARRGFFKEVIHAVALVVAIAAAKAGREPLGAALAAKSGLPLMLAEVAAVIMVWVAVFFIVAVVGRLALKKVRGSGIDDELDEGAEAVADALGGDTSKGPVTLLTDPIASKRGFFYWSDKLLGAGLGLLKGLITGYVLFGLILYADRARGWDSSFARSIEQSHAASLWKEHIEGTFLNSIPEYRIAKSLDDMKAIGAHFKATKDPARFKKFVEDPRLKSLREYPGIKALADDAGVAEAWAARDLKKLLANAKVRALLSDPELRKRLSDVEWEQLRRELEAEVKGAKAPLALPPGAAPEDEPKTQVEDF
ncbi:MAG: CvpA family protein [Planctomycetota bacterium]